jgi:hypothetical protein
MLALVEVQVSASVDEEEFITSSQIELRDPRSMGAKMSLILLCAATDVMLILWAQRSSAASSGGRHICAR